MSDLRNDRDLLLLDMAAALRQLGMLAAVTARSVQRIEREVTKAEVDPRLEQAINSLDGPVAAIEKHLAEQSKV